ncbi:CpsD/CapB family tyrosine-protein kinase [Novosphingobium resinovorum]|uniref:CpsD/CapB family tyrosine-protein kinase n=1 Tax=Novosphingobium resinovorum TaxID=158500 RepID=UPI002ED50740|nr:CpsD/CapB family tyrosine-protein kinase [Novosphingobium resinovorum]
MNAESPIIPEIPSIHAGIGIPAIASITLVPDAAHLARHRIAGPGPLSEAVHPFTMIRSALMEHARASGQRIFAVSSAEPGNGKTHVAANLAMVMARVHPTVLVELDLRRPSLGVRLGLPDDYPGVDDYLAGDCPWISTRAHVEGLDLAVHRVRHPRSEVEALLGSNALSLALRHRHAGDERTIILVDTPPAILSDDLVLIARNVDGVLVVAEEGRTGRRALQEIARALGPTPIVGTVLNRSISRPQRRIDYGYYQERDPR